MFTLQTVTDLILKKKSARVNFLKEFNIVSVISKFAWSFVSSKNVTTNRTTRRPRARICLSNPLSQSQKSSDVIHAFLLFLYLAYISGLKSLPKHRGRLDLPITNGLILMEPVALEQRATVILSLDRLVPATGLEARV